MIKNKNQINVVLFYEEDYKLHCAKKFGRAKTLYEKTFKYFILPNLQ